MLARLPQAMIVASHDRAFREAVTTSAVELGEGRVVAEKSLQSCRV